MDKSQLADAIGQSLPFAVGVAISPVPIIAVVLMLATPRGRVNGPAFLAGWLAGIAALGAVVLLGAGGADASEGGQPADWLSVLKLCLGALLFVVAARQWRGRPAAGDEPEMPAWMRTVDEFSVTRAAGLGTLLSAVNPKNMLLIVGGAAAIAQTGASTGAQAGAMAVFAAVASSATGFAVLAYFALGDRSESVLSSLKDWMAGHDAAIMTVLCVLIGAKLVGDAIGGLA